MSRLICSVLTVLAMMTPASAADAPASTQGADVAAVDQSTPRGALKMLMLLLDRGDEDAIRNAIHVETPQQQEFIDAKIGFASALARLRRQAATTYGDEGAKAIVGDVATSTALAMAQIDQSTEELNDQTATVRPANPNDPPIHLKKIDGMWKVEFAEMTAGVPPDMLPQAARQMQKVSRMLDGVRTEIADGKHETPEAAMRTLQKRQLALQFDAPEDPNHPPATQPTPSTQPSG